MSQQTVTINGTVYDAQTGLPIGPAPSKLDTQESVQNIQEDTPQPSEPPRPQPSQSVHRQVQKSQTLNRRVVKKDPVQPPTQPRQNIQKSPAITKFAPHPAYNKPKSTRTFSDIGPVAHPITQKLQSRPLQATAKQAVKPSQVIKQEAIAEAMQKAPTKAANENAKSTKKWQRFVSIGSISIALLLLGGYFTYLNMPSISVRVAAAQAGVNATYPEFRPDGYSLSGAVAYSQGQVSMKFAANAGSHSYTINQSKSNWDSSAVKDDVDQKTDGKYIAYNERGLTIYTYGSNAMWVNGGVLYTVQGDAPLSSDQIRRIATSM